MDYRNDTLCGIFHNQVLRYGDGHPFLVAKLDEKGRPTETYRSLTWKQTRERVMDLARGLAALGLSRGDRAVLFSESRPGWVIADQAIQACGAIGVPLYPTLNKPDLIYMILDSGSKILVTSSRKKAEAIIALREEASGLKDLAIICMEEWDGGRPARIYSYSEVMDMGREKVSLEEIEARIRSITPDDTVAIIYTSGTTGRSKGVILTQNNFVSNIHQATMSELMVRGKKRDLHLNALVHLPLCHVYARSSDYHVAGLYLGGVMTFAENFDKIAQNIQEVRPNVISSIPRFYEKTYDIVNSIMARQKKPYRKVFEWAMKKGALYADGMAQGKRISQANLLQFGLANQIVFDRMKKMMGMDRLVMALSGGGKLSRDICAFFRAMNIQLSEGYGLTETSPIINFNQPEIMDNSRKGFFSSLLHERIMETTVGLLIEKQAKGISPYANPFSAAKLGICYSALLYKLRVKPGTVGRPVAWTEEKIAPDGEILVKGPQVFSGYWNMAEATKEAFTEDGWFKTGDIGKFDEEGFLMITDRKKDLFVNSGGKNIAPHPIEIQLIQQPHIDQACLVGDGRKYLCALIVPDFKEIRRYAKHQGIPYTTDAELVKREEIRSLIQKEVDEVNAGINKWEEVKYFTLIDHPFSEETGELTPTLKVKRKVVNEMYRELIEGMYT
jgi:long-chain acyl-CoA synthetase